MTYDEENYDPDAILADPNSHPVHRMYAEINIGIRDRGERWCKCANCGRPYMLYSPLMDEICAGENIKWMDETVCSEACEDEYVSYLNSGEF